MSGRVQLGVAFHPNCLSPRPQSPQHWGSAQGKEPLGAGNLGCGGGGLPALGGEQQTTRVRAEALGDRGPRRALWGPSPCLPPLPVLLEM